METKLDLFKWKQYESSIILLTVRWYLKYSSSYRDIVEIMSERGLDLSHTTIMRWVHEFGPEIDKRIRPYLRPTNDSSRTDETYIKVKGQWKYLYRAVDSMGKTIDFMLSENRDMPAAKRFFTKAFTINEKAMPKETLVRQTKYLNNIVEQDHRFIKKITKPNLGFKTFHTAEQTLKGIEAMHMIRKGQAENNSSVLSAVEWLNIIFGIVA
ncbi:transposase [Paenibacillus ferrarius]|uniref:Transposase n=1 Tax=Paenibacillus ferrarius TaxID=1469647 RepID=A0A1V4HBB0_9BACL|nr:IS6 family transposase [Paenibacillus ferrarius]OPH49330.1 transposase [Paenibacillus ferrarius]